MKLINDMYDLALHETCEFTDRKLGRIQILRVPGGWLYNFITCGNLPSIFIPFDTEFEQREREQ